MKIRTRAITMTAFILAFSMMSVPGLIGSQMGLGVAQGQLPGLYPVIIGLSTGETVFIACHTSGLAGGNWIELSGGTSIKLPSLTLAYEGPEYAYYDRDGVTITIESTLATGEATYPLTTHQVYSTGESINAKFWGTTLIPWNEVDFKLISISSITEARDILTSAFQGNLVPLTDKLDGALTTTSPLDDNNDATANIPAQPIGNYLLVVTKEEFKPYKLYIYSATIIEVLEQTLDVTCPSSVERGDTLNVNTGLTGTYVHGAILIRETAYSAKVKLSTLGSVLSTKIYLNDVLMADGAFAIETETLSYDDAVFLLNQLNTAFGSNQFAYGVSLFTGAMSLSTSSLTTGDYVLLVGVYNILDSRIVGIYQKTVRVTSPYIPPPANKLPVANAGPDQKAWVNGTVNFDGSKSTDPDGYIQSWSWSFGDGETASGETVSHTYQEPGSYTVKLTVRDSRYGEDSDTCTVTISEPVEPVTDELEELVPGGETGYTVNATDEANTTVTLDTTDPVTVTIIKYEDNPHPDDPLPATALPHYVDVEISDPEAVTWPIYVEMHYNDEELGDIDESTLGIYYWKDEAWHRCSNTGVDTERNVVWAYMTEEEASGSPILIAGVSIVIPPLPPILSDLTITPSEIELGEEVTIEFSIENIDDQSLTYIVTLQIGESTISTDVELEAYESKVVTRMIIPGVAGDYSVTINGLTGTFKVTIPPLKPAEFMISTLIISPSEVVKGETVTITVTLKNIGEEEGSHMVTLKLDGVTEETAGITLDGGESTIIKFYLTEAVGEYSIEIDGLTGSFTVTPTPGIPRTLIYITLILILIFAAVGLSLRALQSRKSTVEKELGR